MPFYYRLVKCLLFDLNILIEYNQYLNLSVRFRILNRRYFMNLCLHSKKHYSAVMLLEFVFLSIVYWHFFSPDAGSISVYAVSVLFYITGFNFWILKYIKNEHFLMDFTEHFIINNFIAMLAIITIKLFADSGFSAVTAGFSAIILIISAYYMYRIRRQKEIIKNAVKIPVHFKLITLVSILIMCLDFIFFIYGKLSLQLSVYLPIFFILICCIIILFSREISFKSIISLILFSNIFFISSFMIVLNHQNGNYFVFLLIIHFILLSSSACFFKLNNNFSESKDICYSNEFISLLFFSTALIFIFINNILSFEIPKQFVTYISVFVIFFVCYLVYYNYKILANIKNSEINGDHV